MLPLVDSLKYAAGTAQYLKAIFYSIHHSQTQSHQIKNEDTKHGN